MQGGFVNIVHAEHRGVLGGQTHSTQQHSFPATETYPTVTFDSASKSSDQQTVRTDNSSSISSFDQLVSATYSPPKLSFEHDNSSSHDHYKHDLSSVSLTAKLNSYKYLDDYEYFHGERMKQNAMRKFGLIMQSVETRYKDCSKSAFDNKNSIGNLDNEDDDIDCDNALDSDIIGGPTSESSNFNRILKRHRKRFRQNLTNLRHR